ncbi:MAG: tetratricopeptide repeat protein [Ramlibacter sp.]
MAKSIASLLHEAGTHLAQYDLGSALQLYREAMAREPGNAAAAMGMAMVLNRTNKPGEALQLLTRIWASVSRAKQKLPPAQQATVLAQMGLAQQELGQLGAALESYRQAARLVNSEDLNRRIKQIVPLVNSPAPVQQLILHGRALMAARQVEEAAKTYIGALKLQPDNADVLHELAMVLQELGAHDRALPLLQKAVILAPDRPEFFNDLGMLFQRRADFTKAVSFHKRAIKLAPGFVFAYINLGVAHKRLGQNDEALAAYRAALKIDPNSPEANNNLGNLLRVMGQLPLAQQHLEKALKLRPGYADAQANLDAVKLAQQEAKHVAAAPAAKKPAAKTATPRKAPARKAPAKAVPAKAPVAKATPAKKVAAKAPVAKKPAVKKPVAKKAAAGKPAGKRK